MAKASRPFSEQVSQSSQWPDGDHAAGAKVILFGEHAVVYGEPALVFGGKKGARARARQASVSSLRLGKKRFAVEPTVQRGEPAPVTAFRALLCSLNSPNVEVEAELEVPAGMGLGASAALAVAIARAVVCCRKTPAEPVAPERLLQAANAWEGVFHGNASGVDTAAALQAGCLWFSKASGPERLSVASMPHVVVAVADQAASTRTMVELVAQRRQVNRVGVEALFSSITELTKAARLAAVLGDWRQVGGMMTQNHSLLDSLGVSTVRLNVACRIALNAGVYGAKLTGAGGGGCVVALCEAPLVELLIQTWNREGYDAFEFA